MSVDTLIRPSIARDISLTPQAKTVLRHLSNHVSITPMEAMTVYTISRLASCINEIRKAGHRVEMMLREDARGHRYGRYSLVKSVH